MERRKNRLEEENAELKRVLIQGIGYDRLQSKLKARSQQ